MQRKEKRIKLNATRMLMYNVMKNKPYKKLLTLTEQLTELSEIEARSSLRLNIIRFVRKLREKKGMRSYGAMFEISETMHVHCHMLIDIDPEIGGLKKEGFKIIKYEHDSTIHGDPKDRILTKNEAEFYSKYILKESPISLILFDRETIQEIQTVTGLKSLIEVENMEKQLLVDKSVLGQKELRESEKKDNLISVTTFKKLQMNELAGVSKKQGEFENKRLEKENDDVQMKNEMAMFRFGIEDIEKDKFGIKLNKIFIKFTKGYKDVINILKNSFEGKFIKAVLKEGEILSRRKHRLFKNNIIYVYYYLGLGKKQIKRGKLDQIIGEVIIRGLKLFKEKSKREEMRLHAGKVGKLVTEFIEKVGLNELIEVIPVKKERLKVQINLKKIELIDENTEQLAYFDEVPMLSKPKDGIGQAGCISKNYTGGYLGNGIYFKKGLGRGRGLSKLEVSPMIFKCVNYLHATKLCIEKDFGEWIKLRGNEIKKLLYDEKCLEYLDKLEKKELIYDKDNESDRSYYRYCKSNLSKKNLYERVFKFIELFKNEEYFYFTYQLDFRGRFYTCGADISFQGNKLAKAVTSFYVKGYLNDRKAKKYFKMQMSAVYRGNLGYSEKEQLNYYNEISKGNLDNVYDTGKYIEADEFLFLLRMFYENDRGKEYGMNYITGCPCGLDTMSSGSTIETLDFKIVEYFKPLNLLPHFAEDKIQDYYMFLLDLLEEKLSKEEGYQPIYILKRIIKRKLIKKIFMTMNYGLTKGGKGKKGGVVGKIFEACDKYKIGIDNETKIKFANELGFFMKNNKLYKGLDLMSYLVRGLAIVNKPFVVESKIPSIRGNEKNSYANNSFDLKMIMDYREEKLSRFEVLRKSLINKKNQKAYVYKQFLDYIDYKVQERALRANIVHHHDSLICGTVLNYFVEKEKFYKKVYKCRIDVIFIHDSFGCRFEDVEMMHYALKESLIKLYENRDNFENIILKLMDEVIGICKIKYTEEGVNEIEFELRKRFKEGRDSLGPKDASVFKRLRENIYTFFP